MAFLTVLKLCFSLLQRFLSPEGELFHPQYHDRDRELQESEQVLAANAEIGDSDRCVLLACPIYPR